LARLKSKFDGKSCIKGTLIIRVCHTGLNSFAILLEEEVAPILVGLRKLNIICIKNKRRSIANRGSMKLSTNCQTIHWLDESDEALWPSFALEYAVLIWNPLPNKDSGHVLMELWMRMKNNRMELLRVKVWGYPNLHFRAKTPRWKEDPKVEQEFPSRSICRFLKRSLYKDRIDKE
jgi:hypothetical protein